MILINENLDDYDQKIKEFLTKNKDWASMNEIAKKTGMSWVTVRAHLQRLYYYKYVELKLGGRKKYFRIVS